MANLSMRDYVINNDLLGAYDRLTKTSYAWEKRWWATIIEIYNQDKKWATIYILDDEHYRLIEIDENNNIVKDYYSYHTQTDDIKNGHCAYLIYINDFDGNNIYAKVGYSGQLSTRITRLHREYGSYYLIIPKLVFVFATKEAAETMENFMRGYYKSKYLDNFIKQDRFSNIHFTNEDVEVFQEKAKEIENIFDFVY
jgi:hypothetical protein